MKLIKLTKGFQALIDASDYGKVSKFKWCASIESNDTKVYAVRYERDPNKPKRRVYRGRGIARKECWYYPQRKIRLHRFIMGLRPVEPGEHYVVVNHINDDSLDCRKENLEVITQQENMDKVDRWKRKNQKAKKIEDIVGF